MKVIACVAALGLLCVMAGCSEKSGPVDLTPPPTGFQIEMSLSSNLIYRGQNTQLTLEIANYGPDIELDFRCMDHFGFRIENDNGDLVYEYPSCYPNPNHFTIRKGYKNTVSFSVPGGTLPIIEEGYYKVSSGILEHEDLYPWKKAGLVVLEPR